MTDQTNKDLPELSMARHDLFDLSTELLGVIEDVKNGMPFDDVCMETIISVRERLACLDALSASAPAAGSEPSDHDIEMLATGFAVQHRNGLLKFARALLAQYGSAADQEIIEAARNLVKVKGRHHGELAYKRLADAVASAPLVAPITEIVNKHGEV